MIGCNHRFLQRIAAGLAFVAMVALILHGALHIGSHLASELRRTPRPAIITMRRQCCPPTTGSDVQSPKHHHTAHHPGSAPEPASGSDGGLCCCTGISCMAALLPAGSAAVRYAMPHRVLTMLDRDQEAQFKPDGPRRPPRPRLIA